MPSGTGTRAAGALLELPASGARLKVVLGGGLKRVEAGPGEPADKPFVDIGEAGVGEVVAEVVEVGPRPVSAYGLPGRLRVGQRLVPGRNPQPVQDPPVPGVASVTACLAFTAQRGDLRQ